MTPIQIKSKHTTRIIGTIPLCLSLALIGNHSAQALTITPTSDGNTLVNNITGSGITIDPASVNFIGASGSSGIFTDGIASGIGIDSGIILTTGQASAAVGSNSSDVTTTINRVAGDSDLDVLNGSNTSDASVLEFEFESTGGDVFLKYVFASEEYNEFDNAPPNDALAFFLDGENIALVPGTNTPVSVTTVNDGNLLPGDDHSEFYNNNDPSDGGPFFDLEYDGFTDVFTASFFGLTPGSHTLKLAIADGLGDAAIDSAVFIASDSLTDNSDLTTTVPEPSSILSLLGVLFFGSTALNFRKKTN
jgi:hypothetical protein